MKSLRSGFTLVELIVVVVVLSILSWLGFVSYLDYTSSTRDSARISDINSINKALELEKVNKWKYIIPDDKIDILESSNTIAYQWVLWENNLILLDYKGSGLDPMDKNYHNYMVNKAGNRYQIVMFLENQSDDSIHTIDVNSDYKWRYPYVFGDDMWMLFDDTFLSAHLDGNNIDITVTDYNYTWIINNNLSVNWDHLQLNVLWSVIKYGFYDWCKELLEQNKSVKRLDTKYTFLINNQLQSIYCDMTFDWGWWTIVSMNAWWYKADGSRVRNFFNTWVEWYIASIDSDISSKWNLSDLWKDNLSKDIYIQCYSDNPQFVWYNNPLVIFNYKKSDITKLTNETKVWEKFSSDILDWKVNGYRFKIHTDYGTSSSQVESMYIYDAESDGTRWKRIFHGAGWNKIYLDKDNATYSQAYINWLDDVRQDLNSTNYCITAIR